MTSREPGGQRYRTRGQRSFAAGCFDTGVHDDIPIGYAINEFIIILRKLRTHIALSDVKVSCLCFFFFPLFAGDMNILRHRTLCIYSQIYMVARITRWSEL